MKDPDKVWEDLMEYEVIDGNAIFNERKLRKQIFKNDKYGRISENAIKKLMESTQFNRPILEINKIKDKSLKEYYQKKQSYITKVSDFYISIWWYKGKLFSRLRDKRTGRFVKDTHKNG